MHQRIRVAGLVRRGPELLLIRQKDRQGRLHWTLPGGRLEHTDENMYRGAEREVWEETGLEVRAGSLRFIVEDLSPGLFALTLIIECHLIDEDSFDRIHLDNTMEDDNIHGVAWWHTENIRSAAEGIGQTLQRSAFWEALENGVEVLHLGRNSGLPE